jgi:hypothetical protein
MALIQTPESSLSCIGIQAGRDQVERRAARRNASSQLSWFACPTLSSCSTPHRRRRRLLFEKHPLELLEIAIIEKPADHVRRDLRGADRVKLMPGHEFESSIGTRQRSFETRVEKVARFFHDHAGAIRMVVRQPEEGHGLSLAFRPSIFRRSRFEWSRRRRAMWGASAGTGAQPMRLEPRARLKSSNPNSAER